MMKVFALCCAMAALLPIAALPQLPADRGHVGVGGGIGVTQSDGLSGSAYHVQTHVTLARFTLRTELVGDAFFQGGTVSGGPPSCESPSGSLCIGRTDRNRILGLSAQIRQILGHHVATGVSIYGLGGVGAYARWTRSHEAILTGDVVSRTDPVTSNPRSLGYMLGAGLSLDRGPVGLFLELQAHQMFEPGESIAGALPVTLGIRF